jgi:quercetin dioxygenase-like cupin family protein
MREASSIMEEVPMAVHIQNREGGEPLGSSVLLAAFDDLMLSEYVLEPGTEPGEPHYHANHTDAFYVIAGELEFVVDGEPVRVGAGTLVAAPRGEAHAFPVAVGGPARFLNIHAPGGFERYMRALVQMRARGEAPDPEFQRQHDQHLV